MRLLPRLPLWRHLCVAEARRWLHGRTWLTTLHIAGSCHVRRLCSIAEPHHQLLLDVHHQYRLCLKVTTRAADKPSPHGS